MVKFGKANVRDYHGDLVYSGRMSYDLERDVSSYDLDRISDELTKAQNDKGAYRALDKNQTVKFGSYLNRSKESDPFYDFEVTERIDEQHPEYQSCVEELNEIEKLPWEIVDKNTLWVAKMMGYRKVGTYDELKPYLESPDLRDVDTLVWEQQPKELQEFYKDYQYATYDLGRHDLYYLQDFYKEWQKDSDQFKPKATNKVIGRLNDYVDKLPLTDNLRVSNYYGFGAGNHRVGNFVEALEETGLDFDVIGYEAEEMHEWDDRPTHHITIQTDDLDALHKLSVVSNQNAITHSLYGGDGKYETPEEEKPRNEKTRAFADMQKNLDDLVSEKGLATEDEEKTDLAYGE